MCIYFSYIIILQEVECKDALKAKTDVLQTVFRVCYGFIINAITLLVHSSIVIQGTNDVIKKHISK